MPPRTSDGDGAGDGTALVRRLLQAQFPHWADLPLTPTGSAGTSSASSSPTEGPDPQGAAHPTGGRGAARRHR